MADAAVKDSHDAAKNAAPPLKLKKIKDEALDEAEEKPAAPAKQKTLATALSRGIVIATVIGSIAYAATGLLGNRYTLTPAPNTNNNFVYRIDRLTGAVQFCGQQQCTDLGRAEK